MALLPHRQIHSITTEYQVPFSSERGGILTLGSFSGLIMAHYHENPSGKFAIGIKMVDTEYLDLSREPAPHGWGMGLRETSQPMDSVPILDEGEIVTNFIHPDGAALIKPGVSAYAGPSGTLTPLSSYGGQQVGYFLSSVNSAIMNLPQDDLRIVTWMGGGLTWSFNTPYQSITIVNPTEINIAVAGYAKVRISIRSAPNVVIEEN